MTPLQRTIAGIASLLLILVVGDLVRRRKLREEYSILWLAGGLLVMVVSLHGKAVTWLSSLLATKHAAYSLFAIAFAIGTGLAIHFTVVLSKLTAQIWRLTQESGRMKTEIEKLKAHIDRR